MTHQGLLNPYPKTPEQIAQELNGTCKSLHGILYDNEMEDAENDIEFCRALDDIVFLCVHCEWWHEISEAIDVNGHEFSCYECIETS